MAKEQVTAILHSQRVSSKQQPAETGPPAPPPDTNPGDALVRLGTLQGVGLAYLPEEYVAPLIRTGELVRVLEAWCEPFPGYHLYYPSRRQHTPAFALLLEALRYRERADPVRYV
mgnify:CR=1 FL=1